MVHTGRAVVFEDSNDFHARIDDDNLDVDETCILVLKNCGPKGYPGMAEVGNMPLPPKVLKKGITDMVRISDARMSGTAYGTVVLHTTPEAAAGGPLAVVRNGDMIELNVPAQIAVADQRRRTATRLAANGPPPSCPDVWLLEALHRHMCCRLTRVPTSTFWLVSVGLSCPRTTTDHDRHRLGYHVAARRIARCTRPCARCACQPARHSECASGSVCCSV
jgi:hypothetical protein